MSEDIYSTKKVENHTQTNGLFLREFLRTPGKIGAIVPSSKALAHEIVDRADVAESSVIVEYGAGTGVFTEEILRRKKPDAVFLAIESNPAMVQILRQRFPGLTILESSVEKTPQRLKELHFARADSIVSGLPWSSFSDELQTHLLKATLRTLRPGGVFATFAYLTGLALPASASFRRKIKKLFSEVSISSVIWQNLPPAIIYRCTK